MPMLDYLGSEWAHFQARADYYERVIPGFIASAYWQQVERALWVCSIEQALTQLDVAYLRYSSKETTNEN